MKKINYILGLLAVSLVIFSSCGREELDYGDRGGDIGGISGQLNLSAMMVTLVEEGLVEEKTEVKSLSRAVSTDNFIVRVYKITATGESKVKEWKYKEMPDIIALSIGEYRLEVHSHDPLPMEWENPYYYVDADFEIHENTITDLGQLVCTQQSIKVTVEYDDELLKHMGDDAVSTVKIGGGSAVFEKGESRAAYFYTKDMPAVLVSEFVGTVAGESIVLRTSFTDVEVSQHRKICYTLKGTDLEGNLENGTITPSFLINAVCEVVNKNNNVTVAPEPVIPDVTEPDPDDPSDEDKPVIVGNGIGTPLTLPTDQTIAVSITAPKGIKELVVDIVSPTLTPEELEAVGLTDHLDLINPGEFEEALIGLGFPVKDEVLNNTQASFDVTMFGPMLSALGAGEHHFVITVVDNAGNDVEEHLVLITQ